VLPIQRSAIAFARDACTGVLMMRTPIAANTASKAAVSGMVKAMAKELGPYNIRVNTIAPGPFATPMVAGLFERDEYREAMLAGMAQHRIAEPEEIVGAALFLTGPDATFITGAVLTVDGGWTSTTGSSPYSAEVTGIFGELMPEGLGVPIAPE